LPDFLLVEVGNLGKVKRREVFDDRYLRLLQPPLPSPRLPLQNFLFSQRQEIAGITLVALGRFSRIRFMMADEVP